MPPKALTLLALLCLCYQDKVGGEHIQEIHPQLYASIQQIFCHQVVFESKRDEMLANFKLSVRGSIRKPPNAVVWEHG